MDRDIALWIINPSLTWDSDDLPSDIQLAQAYIDYLNSYGKDTIKEIIIKRYEEEAKKYLDSSPILSLEYIKKSIEVDKFKEGKNKEKDIPLAYKHNEILGMPIAEIILNWEATVDSWGVIGGRLSALRQKYLNELSIVQFQGKQDYDDFVDMIIFEEEI